MTDEERGHVRDFEEILFARGPPSALVGHNIFDALRRNSQADSYVGWTGFIVQLLELGERDFRRQQEWTEAIVPNS
jgi:hypothetical protein